MRKVLTAVLMLSTACEVAAPSSEPARQQLALPGLPVLVSTLPAPRVLGTVNAELGTSLAACRSSGYVAGAPGVAKVVLVRGDAGLELGPFGAGPAASGLAVACEDHPNNRRVVFSGGTAGLFVGDTDGGVTQVFQGAQVNSLARNPELNLLLTGEPPVARVLNSLNAQQNGLVTGSGMFGSSVVFPNPDAGFFAVGDPGASKVYLFELTDGGVVPLGHYAGMSNSRFGQALAVGDVHPSPGLELIIAAPDSAQVLVYANPRRVPTGEPPLLTLTPNFSGVVSDSEFGSALAVQPNAAQQLGGIWVGSPGDGRVQRYIGSSVDATWELLGSRLGNAIAVDRSMVVVGAPAADGGAGAVFELTAFPANNGKQMQCVKDQPCGLPNCAVGTCVGGVFCSDALTMTCPNACVAPDVCDVVVRTDSGMGGGGGAMPIGGGGVGAMGGGVGTMGGGVGAVGGGIGAVGGGIGANGGGVGTVGGGVGTVGGGVGQVGGGVGTVGGGVGAVGGGVGVLGGGVDANGGGSANTGGGSGSDDGGANGGGAGPPADLIQYNATCGCSSASALPTLLLGLFLARRWRRSSRNSA